MYIFYVCIAFVSRALLPRHFQRNPLDPLLSPRPKANFPREERGPFFGETVIHPAVFFLKKIYLFS